MSPQSVKVALVTGGANGIGKAIVNELLNHGFSVSVCDIDKTAGQSLIRELSEKHNKKLIFLECDVADNEMFEECFKKTKAEFGGLDIVVNNAGVGSERDDKWKKLIDINLKGVIHGTQLGMRYMGRDEGGRGGIVVNVGSTTILEPYPATPIYSATKAALNQYTRSIGDDLYFKKCGVKVVGLNPGLTTTPLSSKDLSQSFPDDEIANHFISKLSTLQPQSAENVGRGLLEILQKADNGSLWTVQDDLPPQLTIMK